MDTEDRWLLPEGIQEVLPRQAVWLERHRRLLLDMYATWGYELVVPPFIEYLDSLLIGNSPELDLQTFKLTDQLNGRLMGVRADMSPQVARIDAHMLKRDVPTRLCYLGTVLRTRPDDFNGSRSPLQIGAEIYGHAGIGSDVEIIRLMLETLRATSITHVHLDLGHAGVYRGLAQQAGLNRNQTSILFDMLQRKAQPEIEQFLRDVAMDNAVAAIFRELVNLNGGMDVIARARDILSKAAASVHASLDYLETLATKIAAYEPDLELFIDIAESRGYHYETGIVFAAYVQDRGQEIARGGRYDEIGKVFGRARPATGFSADLHTLMNLSDDSDTSKAQGMKSRGIFARSVEDAAQQQKAEELRKTGERVVFELEGQSGDADSMGCDRELVLQSGKWVVRPLP